MITASVWVIVGLKSHRSDVKWRSLTSYGVENDDALRRKGLKREGLRVPVSVTGCLLEKHIDVRRDLGNSPCGTEESRGHKPRSYPCSAKRWLRDYLNILMYINVTVDLAFLLLMGL